MVLEKLVKEAKKNNIVVNKEEELVFMDITRIFLNQEFMSNLLSPKSNKKEMDKIFDEIFVIDNLRFNQLRDVL